VRRGFLLLSLLFYEGFAEDFGRKLIPMTTGATFSPTFTTMNYSYVPKYMRHQKKIESFIENNMDDLKVEVAQGEGEHLDTLESYFNPAYSKRWRVYLQEHFEEVFGGEKDMKSAEDVFYKINTITVEKFERKRI
jgi:hypothetical protein